MLVLEVERPTVDLAALGRAQANTAPLAQAMSAYVAWLAPQMSPLPTTPAAAFAEARQTVLADDPHLRVPEAIAHLYLGLDLGLCCAQELGACSPDEGDALRRLGLAPGW